MWQEVPRQINLLVGDYLEGGRTVPEQIRLLDIGCGTGLASDSMLKSKFGPRIVSVDLLDTSPRMLEKAKARSASWGVPVEIHNGITTDLAVQGKQYNCIVTCSVLHHVPDNAAFLRDVAQMQPSGVFLHVQDPNGDHLENAELKRRRSQVEQEPLETRSVTERIWNKLKRQFGEPDEEDYVARTNQVLLRQGVIRTPLTVTELYSITDIHVLDGQGASIRRMRAWLPDYDLVSQRAYSFFGLMPLHLPDSYRAQEEELIAQKALNGFHIGALWAKR